MYFLLAGIVEKFVYLKYGLAAILTFIGAKMISAQADWIHLPHVVSLGVILFMLGASVAASLMFPPKAGEPSVEIEGKTGSIFGTVLTFKGTKEKKKRAK
jgi:predicted tellurium resistance membrane protein TerC